MADDKKPKTPTDNVEVKSDKAVDPQLILTLATKDGSPFNAVVEVDLTVRNVQDRRVFGHARTMDIVRDAEVTIPINFNDSIKEWKRACGIPGAQLGYGVAVHLYDEDGNEQLAHLYDYMTPTYDPPITMDGVWNQYDNDQVIDHSGEGSPLAPGTILTKGDKFNGPNGVFYLSFQHDGNLVVKAIDGDHFWWGSHNHIGVPLGGTHATVEADGNLHIYDENNGLLWRSESENGAAVFIDESGKPVVLDDTGEINWMG